jgi:predicted dehydrogenase
MSGTDPTDCGRRRLFHQGLGLVAAVGACSRDIKGEKVSPVAQQSERAQPPPALPKLGWAVVGLGKFATEQILPSFAACERSRLVALVSGTPDKARRIADQYGVPAKNIYEYQRFDEIRQNPEIDVVYVILPNSMHAEYSQRAARAGKHVMCEKPMAVSARECEAMIAASKAAGRKLMVAYRAQFEPNNRAAIEMVRRGEIGALKVIVADHGRTLDLTKPADQWRAKKALAGGGSLMDIGIYSLQAARYITGQEPVEVTARSYSTPGDPRFAEVEETVTFTLRFPNGVLANCTSSYGYEDVKRYRVFGDRGYLDLDPATAYQGNVLRVSKSGKPSTLVEVPRGNQFALEMDHLSDCIQTNKSPRTPGEEGLRDVRIMDAIYTAAREGRPIRPSAT